ncbi:AAA family ATPase, partial [Nocardioides marmoraquaticus]
MRLHHLEITAFGPFAGTVGVDFDDLGAAGLFLLTGDTGAGKSSVLDAVCFALYGEVPGDRGGARHLRSDHAAPDAEPRVVLTFSVGDRRLRLSRSPAWDRPKRRGSGTRRIQAAVVAEEHRDGAWQAVSTRLDETGQLVGDLLGMTGSQFTQVAMLPQGRFQTFLRASSAERHDVLKRLFRTRRYDDVERWLAERRREAQRAASDRLGRCAALLDRLGEATGVDLPTRPDVEGAAHGDAVSTEVLQDLAPGELAQWVEDRAAQVVRDVRDARARETEAAEVTAGLRARLEHEETLQRRQQHGAQARRRLAELDATADDADLARG